MTRVRHAAAGGLLLAVALAGAVHAQAARAPAGQILLSASGLSFGSVPVRSFGPMRTVEVWNAGVAPAPVLASVGPGAFRLDTAASTCTRLPALPPGDECAVGVRFLPGVVGLRRGVLVVRAGGARLQVGLTGHAVLTAAANVTGVGASPATIAFGRRQAGTRSSIRLVHVLDYAASTVSIHAPRLTGANPASFRIGVDTCPSVLPRAGTCSIAVRFIPNFVGPRAATLAIPDSRGGERIALSGTGVSAIPSVPNTAATLAWFDRACFYAPAARDVWPVYPDVRPHPIRGGFNDPRSAVLTHFGVDVATGDQAPSSAVHGGVIAGIAELGTSAEHFELLPSGGVSRYFYYHVNPAHGDGVAVAAGQTVGRVGAGFDHVHLSEFASGCGLVDPRRPTGDLVDPADSEPPVIGPISAYRADAAAFRPFPFVGAPRDTSTPLYLDYLHGRVDFRATVTDTPRDVTRLWPQQPLMVAGVRSYLAPIGRPNRHYASMMRALDGSRLIDPTRIFDVLAPGTVRETGCFDGPGRTCRTVLDLHVAGTGFDTRRVANGNYLYCVGAVTIRNHAARRCVPVTVLN